MSILKKKYTYKLGNTYINTLNRLSIIRLLIDNNAIPTR